MKSTQSKLLTRLFEHEGKQNLAETIRAVVKAADALDIRHVVVFTSDGDSVLSLRRRLADHREIYAATFPHEMVAHPPDGPATFMGIPSRDIRLKLDALEIPIVQGSMPFRVAPESDTSIALRYALGVFGGGVQLCIQAVLMACDAGYLDAGERCIGMSADTAMIMRAGHSWQFLRPASTIAVEHILCKPQYYQISRGDQELEIARYYSREPSPAKGQSEAINVTPKAIVDKSGDGERA